MNCIATREGCPPATECPEIPPYYLHTNLDLTVASKSEGLQKSRKLERLRTASWPAVTIVADPSPPTPRVIRVPALTLARRPPEGTPIIVGTPLALADPVLGLTAKVSGGTPYYTNCCLAAVEWIRFKGYDSSY